MGADQSASKESNEWTSTRMPDLLRSRGALANKIMIEGFTLNAATATFNVDLVQPPEPKL
jgi:hypothetical protein